MIVPFLKKEIQIKYLMLYVYFSFITQYLLG